MPAAEACAVVGNDYHDTVVSWQKLLPCGMLWLGLHAATRHAHAARGETQGWHRAEAAAAAGSPCSTY